MYDVFQTDRLIDLWLAEDIGACDLTALVMIEADERGAFTMNAREPIVVAGIDIAARVFKRYDPDVDVRVLVRDGERVAKGAKLMNVSGPARSLLAHASEPCELAPALRLTIAAAHLHGLVLAATLALGRWPGAMT